MPRHQLLAFSLVFYGGMIAIALAWDSAQDLSLFAGGLESQEILPIVVNLGLGFGFALAFHLFTRVTYARFEWSKRLTDWLVEELGHITVGDALFLALLSGIGEELLFRGAMLSSWGLPISTVIFALVHWAPNKKLRVWTLMAGVSGLIFGAAVLWRGSLVPAIAGHVGINFINLAYISRLARKP